MSSNSYSSYNHPYQASSAQQYSAYQTAPAAGEAVQSPQYHQPPSIQGGSYMPYASSSYSAQGSGYGTGQDDSWDNSNYGGTRETTSRAAEVLRNMSNTGYANNTTSAANQPGFTAANTTTTNVNRYAASSSRSPQVQPQQVHAPPSSYGRSQARPRSVNTNPVHVASDRGLPSPATTTGYPSQRAQSLYNQQKQASASPAPHQYSAAPVSSARTATMPAAGQQQYNDYNHRQLPNAEPRRPSQHASTAESYVYGAVSASNHSSAPTAPPPSSAATNAYAAQTTTVDPMAVYDPWPEYQRKQDVIRAQKKAEDAARAHEEKIAREAREAEEKNIEEERERNKPKPKPRAKKVQKPQPDTSDATAAAPRIADEPEGALAAEIRAMMAKMRELNGKDPALLARIWEEERKAKAPKSPVVPTIPTQQPVAQPAVRESSATKSTPRKESVNRQPKPPSMAIPATPVNAQAVPVIPQAQAIPNRPSGNTFWPPEKRANLAKAAANFLNAANPTYSLSPDEISSILDGNPSYIQLCEQLEHMGLKLDRAAFAKNLLAVVPDINGANRKAAQQPAIASVQRVGVPPAVMKNDTTTPAAASSQFTPASASPANRYGPHSTSATPTHMPASVAEMIAIKPELKIPANKEEAARKRNMSDLIDMTLLSDEENMGPPPKRLNSGSLGAFGSPQLRMDDPIDVDAQPAITNFPTANLPSQPTYGANLQLAPPPPSELRHRVYVQNLDRSNALRRNSYNPATIARDVLLACGRHPSERQLNQHLDGLRLSLQNISFDSDLSTIDWQLIDPGAPPPGYFIESVQALTEDADDEGDLDEEDHATKHASGANVRVQALPEAINPFKQKRPGRPPRHSYPDGVTPTTPKRPVKFISMSASASGPKTTASGVGYQAFRSTAEFGLDGQPLPKKKGRPVGWRKAIHGAAAAQARLLGNGHTGSVEGNQPSQPSALRHVKTSGGEPIQISSRSPSVANHTPRHQSYKCKWQGCKAQLHNLETLVKHVFKLHCKVVDGNSLQCLWDDCSTDATRPHPFDLESDWRDHIQHKHFDPLSWKLGDGPASGLSDANDSEAYLSDAHGRQVTPRIRVDPKRALESGYVKSAPRGRGRPPKITQEAEAREAYARLVTQKKRIGGPGMDRGGATLVNDKRRRGLVDNPEAEEELVDAED